MDEEPIAQPLDLDTALEQFLDNKPDGFLLRLVVFDDEETDISSATLKKCDEILGVIIKSAMSMGLQQPSQAVHFLWTSLEEE